MIPFSLNIFRAASLALCTSLASQGAAQALGEDIARERLGQVLTFLAETGQLPVEGPTSWDPTKSHRLLGKLNGGQLIPDTAFSASDTIVTLQADEKTLRMFKGIELQHDSTPPLTKSEIPDEFDVFGSLPPDKTFDDPREQAALFARLWARKQSGAGTDLTVIPQTLAPLGSKKRIEQIRIHNLNNQTTLGLIDGDGSIRSTGEPMEVPTLIFNGLQFNSAAQHLIWNPEIEKESEIRMFDPALGQSVKEGEAAYSVNCRTKGLSEAIPCGLSSVMVHNKKEHDRNAHCSGVVISPRHVLTAAHCVFPKEGGPPGAFRLFDTTKDNKHPRPFGLVVTKARCCEINASLQGESSSSPTFYDQPDLALLELQDNHSSFSGRFKDVRIAPLFLGDIAKKQMIAIGYGKNNNIETSGNRQIAILGSVDEPCPNFGRPEHSKCNETYEFIQTNLEDWDKIFSKLHTSKENSSFDEFEVAMNGQSAALGIPHDTCNGDSGGPIFILGEEHWSVAGITSRSLLTKEALGGKINICKGLGSIHTRVGSDQVIKWLERTLRDADCPPVLSGNYLSFPKCN